MNRILVYGMTSNPGGIESYVMNEFSLLDSKKATFDFVCDFPEMCYAEEVKAKGSKIYFIPAKGKKLFSHLFAWFKLLKAHPEYKKVYFNILDAGGVISALVPWLMHREIIVHSHNGSTDKQKLHKLCKPILKIVASKKLACSKVAAEYMFDSENIDVIPNAIACEKYRFNEEKRQHMRRELGLSEDEFVLCFVGRLSFQKNVRFLIDVFGKALEKNQNSTLLIVGAGEERASLISHAEELGISEKIKFLGKRSDVADILQAADVFVMTSLFEGLSVVAVEAQASGLPCVFSDRMSKETKINPNVCFVSLDDGAEHWAKTILEQKNNARIADVTLLRKAGYDLEYTNEAQANLLSYFYS